MCNSSLELLYALDLGPLVVIQDARRVEQKVTLFIPLFNLACWRLLSERDLPLAAFILPFGAHNFGIKRHVLAQVEDFYYFRKIFMNVWCIGEKAGPVRI